MACYICENLEAGDTLYASSDWDGGLGFDYIRDIQYCPVCGRKLAEQTEPKRGEWKWRLADNGWKDIYCSECGYTKNVDIHVHIGWNFCPNCGTDMRKS